MQFLKVDFQKIIIFMFTVLTFFSADGNIFNIILKGIIYLLGLVYFSQYIKKEDFKLGCSLNSLVYFLLFLTYLVSIAIASYVTHDIKWLNITLQLIVFIIIIKAYSRNYIVVPDWICILSVLGLTFQMFFNKTPDNRGYLLSVPDPNYTGYWIFLWVVFMDLAKKRKYAVILGLLGLFTLSRNYLLVVFMYVVISRIKIIKSMLYMLLKKLHINFILACIFSTIIVLYTTLSFVSNTDTTDFAQNDGTVSMIDRLTTLKDGSNWERMTANIIFLYELDTYPDDYILGYGNLHYKETIANVPHNAFFLGIVNYGIIFIVYFLIYTLTISKMFFLCNLEIFLPVIFVTMYLGLGFNGTDVILLALISRLNYNQKISLNINNKISWTREK